MTTPIFRRILLKLSGEALQGDKGYGIAPPVLESIAEELKEVHGLGVQIAIVIGGGIGSGRQLAAVLAMGGDAVLMGTRMLVAEELWIHPSAKERVVRGDGTESVIVKKSLRDHHRVYRNESAEAALALFYTNVEMPIRATNATELTLAQAILRSIESAQVVPKAMAGFFRAHMEAAITRFRCRISAPPSACFNS